MDAGFRVGPVTRAVLHADNGLWVGLHESLEKVNGQRDLGDLGDVVDIDLQSRVCNPLNDFAVVGKEPIVRNIFVVEGWQHQYAACPQLNRRAGHLDGIVQAAGPGPGHHLLGRQPCLHKSCQGIALLTRGQAVGFGVGSKHRQTNPIVEQPAALMGQAADVGITVSREGRDDR